MWPNRAAFARFSNVSSVRAPRLRRGPRRSRGRCNQDVLAVIIHCPQSSAAKGQFRPHGPERKGVLDWANTEEAQ